MTRSMFVLNVPFYRYRSGASVDDVVWEIDGMISSLATPSTFRAGEQR